MSDKFKKFEELCKTGEASVILCTNLWVLGDTVEEVTRNIKTALKSGKSIVCTEEGFTMGKTVEFEDEYWAPKFNQAL